MKKFFGVVAFFLLTLSGTDLVAQISTPRPSRGGTPQGQDADAELDSLRKLEDEGRDTLIITAKYIRYTTLGLLQDSTQTLPLDTSFRDFQYYNPLNKPKNPQLILVTWGLPTGNYYTTRHQL